MKYFLDSAKLDEIKYAYENYGIDGVTTNPKHIKLSGKPFMTCVKEIAQWLKDAGLEGKDFPVSFVINPHLDKAVDIVAAAKEVASYSPNPFFLQSSCCDQTLFAAWNLNAVYEASFEHPFTTHGLGIFREAWDSTATE